MNYSYAACRNKRTGENIIIAIGPGLQYRTSCDLLSEYVVYGVYDTLEGAENWFYPEKADKKTESVVDERDKKMEDFRQKCDQLLSQRGGAKYEVLHVEHMYDLDLIVGQVFTRGDSGCDLTFSGTVLYNVNRKTVGYV